MSRLVELLQKLRRSPSPIGFGVVQAAPTPKRMLLVACVQGALDVRAVAGLSKAADSVAIVCSAAGQSRVDWSSTFESLPVGVWLEAGAEVPMLEGNAARDFIVCGPDAPAELLACKDTTCLVRVTAGVEGSRLRAIADLGAEAVVLSAEGLELGRISSSVECRRVRLMSGKPVLLQAASLLTPAQVAVLWRAGVDGVFVDAGADCSLLLATRAAVEKAPYESRGADSRGPVSIGAHLSHAEQPPAEKEEEEGDEEEEPDDDE